MTRLLYGAPAADAVKAQTAHIVEELGFSPVLAILRAGEEPDDLAYERSVRKICAKCGVDVYTAVLPGYVPQDALVKAAHKLGQDPGVHGVIVMMSLTRYSPLTDWKLPLASFTTELGTVESMV